MLSSAPIIRSKASMAVHRTVQSIRTARRAMDSSLRVGFVPTMGALHDGHLSLVQEARSNSDIVVASIFVNPTQFAPGEDLDKYPRQLQHDTELLSEMGVDHLFAPDQMYGPDHVTYVDLHDFETTSEGKTRPGHFRGVATVVTKLFNIVQPTTAYFGQKDAAQCVLIRRIAEDLDMGVEICVQSTIREKDGLAMSSRNVYLSTEERQAAPIVYRSLQEGKNLVMQKKDDAETVTSKHIKQAVEATLRNEPLVVEIQYISVDDKLTMHAIEKVNKRKGAIISVAVKIGKVRLIDNIVIGRL